jgi:hypothetical protein
LEDDAIVVDKKYALGFISHRRLRAAR